VSDPNPSILAHLMSQSRELANAAMLAGAGVAVGIGQLLHSKEPLTWRIVVGRAMSSGGLGMAAGAALSWAPDLPFGAQLGIAAALASLGTSGLERVFGRVVGGSAAREGQQ
jgi:hypothetical protein